MLSSKRSDERGFTVIEVLVAATILITSVLASLALLDTGTRTTAVSKQRDVGNALAQEMVERAQGGRYTTARNDMTDVDPTAPLTLVGPADRMRVSLDPDLDQGSTAVAPETRRTGALPLDAPQSWSIRRRGTAYTVSYRACTLSDAYQGVEIAGPFDCSRATFDPDEDDQGTSGNCSVGAIPPPAVDPANPGDLTVRLQVLGIVGLNACVGALSPPLAGAVCTLLGSSPALNAIRDQLLGSQGLLTNLLGGLAGATLGTCPTAQVEQELAGAIDGTGTSTRVAVSVTWTDYEGRARRIDQSALVRRPAA